MKFGIIGLGKMGMALAKHALREGFELVAYNRTISKVEDIVKEGAIGAYTLEEVVQKLEPPRDVKSKDNAARIVWLMVTAGKPIDIVLGTREENKGDKGDGEKQGLVDLLEEGDIVIDAVNSHYRDSIRRGRVLLKKEIQFLDVGTSGGIEGAEKGACFMIGGPEEAFRKCEPIFKALAAPGGYAYFGKAGSGHFVKMVHNGIEYALMQALGEGMNILEKSEFEIDLAKVAKVWNHGSIIQSRLVGWLHKALTEDVGLKNSPAEVGSLGTGRWTVEEALRLGAPTPNIANAVFARYESRDRDSLIYKVVQALRKQFGGHTPDERQDR